jgi:hypothetical protein
MNPDNQVAGHDEDGQTLEKPVKKSFSAKSPRAKTKSMQHKNLGGMRNVADTKKAPIVKGNSGTDVEGY